MAFSNTFDTTSPGSAALNREDLHDAITQLAPSETPVLSSAEKFKANATYVEWGVDKLSAPTTTAVAEGADVSNFDDKFENVARLGNYVHKLRRSYRVSGVTNSLTLVADTALRRAITDFARADTITGAVRQNDNSYLNNMIKLAVGVYQSDHGLVTIVDMNPDCSPDTTNKDVGYLVNPEYYAVGELISLGSTRLPNLGGGERGYVDWTGTLKVSHPGAHGVIVGTS